MNRKNYIKINIEYCKEVTNIPHFIAEVNYEGCKIQHDDIYFDDLNEILSQLEIFERTRKNKIAIDGGPRFNLELIPSGTGGMKIICNSEKFNLPGKVKIEAYFDIDGEHVTNLIDLFRGLFTNGTQLII